jgi:Ca-activated chloride channel family protein
VLLIDVSGSMSADNKLPLVQQSLHYFVDELREQDRIAMVTYSGNAGLALEATPGDKKTEIKDAIDGLSSGGSTAGAEGIKTAYEIAGENFMEGGNNRVILATDGDFNVGISDQESLVELIESKRDKGIYLTVLGVGGGNLNDAMMEQVANNGNGTYEYIDNILQAQKVFIHEFGKFHTVAKDVKVQVEFNADRVKSYRLIGYENRVLEEEDFEDDEKDAGEIGAGQCITALYEIIPAEGASGQEALTVDFRYKVPGNETSVPIELDVDYGDKSFADASEDSRFASAVAAFSLLLRNSEYIDSVDYENVKEWAENAKTFDPHAYKEGFIDLINKMIELQ